MGNNHIMQNSFTAKPHIPTRQDQLNAWLALNRLTRNDIAERMGITGAMVGMILNGTKRATPKRLQQLIDLGIPAYLLPSFEHHTTTQQSVNNNIDAELSCD